MDHLPLPRNPISGVPRIPCLCPSDDDSPPYDGGMFSTYPIRAGWPNAQPGVFAPFFLSHSNHWQKTGTNDGNDHVSSKRELESFLQAWLFFGALHVFLAPEGLYDAKAFIGRDSEGQFIHTRNLMEKLENWKTVLEALDGDVRSRRLGEIEECFTLSREVIPMASRTDMCFSMELMRSLAVLHETLAVALNDAFETTNSPWHFWSFHDVSKPNEHERQLMVEKGWCPFDIELAMQDFPSAAGRYYVQRLDKGSPGLHDHCDLSSCRRVQINMSTYQPRHVDESCSCKLLEANPQEVSNCLQNGTYPVFRVDSEANEVSIRIQPYEDGVPYIALSHIWADGLGNPQGTKLPTCQLLRLQRLADNLIGQTYMWRTKRQDKYEFVPRTEDRRFFLWCDSLCCPPAPPGCTEQERRLKHLALGRIMEVYRKAALVLVLERSVETLAYGDLDPFESAIRVFTSGWVRRLWTFQETALARKVLVQFREERPVDFAQLWKVSQETARSGHMSMRVIAHNVTVHFGRLRNYYELAETPEPDIRLVVRALAYRKASVASDEPICLGAVLGLDVQKIARTPDEERMAEMWRLLSLTNRGIPDTIVFNPLPRIEKTGFRWAPATILTDDASIDREISLLAREENPTPARITPDGLCIYRPGWRIRHGRPPPGFPPNVFGATLPPQPIFFLRDFGGKWLSVRAFDAKTIDHPPTVVSPGNMIKDESREWYLLSDERKLGEYGSGGSRGIVGYFQANANGIPVFKPATLVWICRVPPMGEIVWEASYQASLALQRSWSIFSFGVLARIRNAATAFSGWLPANLRDLGMRLLGRIWDSLNHRITLRLATDLRTVCRDKLSSPHVIDAMTKNGMSVNQEYSVALTPTVLTGRFVYVVEELQPTTEWIVD